MLGSGSRCASPEGFDEWLRREHRFHEERERKARENGFSSYAEKEQALMEEYDQTMKEFEKQAQEEMAQGKSYEEAYRIGPGQMWEEPEPLPPCSCVEHIGFGYPPFCPERLVDYRSIDDDMPEVYEALGHGGRARIDELVIKPGEDSKRLSDSQIQKVWAFDSQDRLPELPFWAKQNKTMQRLVEEANSLREREHLHDPSTPPSSRRTSSGSNVSQGSSGTSISVNISQEAEQQLKETVPTFLEPQPPPLQTAAEELHMHRGRFERSLRSRGSKPSKPIQSALFQPRPASIAKPKKPSNQRIIETRSRRPARLYQLDTRGRPILRWNRLRNR